jgi:hypothetical protein
MANTIQIKRGTGVPSSGLSAGEPLYNTSDSRFWIASNSTTANWIGAPILDEDDMASNSDKKLATQQSIKAYVTSQVEAKDAFSELTDTNISTPQSGQIPVYDGTNSWDNISVGGDATMNGSGQLTIADNAITNAKMADDSVDSAEIADGAIDTAHIADSQVTNAKLANSSVTISADSGSNDSLALGETLTLAGTSGEVETTVTNNQVQIGLPNNVTIAGNLTVNGTTTTIESSTIAVEDPLISLAKDNTSSDAVDIGFYGAYSSSGTKYTGMFSDADNSHVFTFFKNNSTAPTATVDTSDTNYALAGIKCDSVDGATIDGGSY